ncbi:MAG: aminopeptidase [Bacteroidaceae bacterium]|nr:aminopeptidase [Bacteroidaceae bacterium]
MKKHLITTVLLILATISVQANNESIEKMLSEISAISSYQKIEKKDSLRAYYLMKFTQLLDPENAADGTFEQRVMLGHRGFDRPMVIVTEGYGADYAFNSPKYMEELTRLLDANILFVEYRFFSQSKPVPCNWDYMTIANSMHDYHAIVTAFKEYYTKKWAATGISKGGSTTMFYRAYYPNDVDVSVPYVAPLSCALEDGRHESFLEQASTKAARDAIRNFQFRLLEEKEQMLPLFDSYCLSKDYTFYVPTSVIYDLCVLEYQFSFWQWGMPVANIPPATASVDEAFSYLIKNCEPGYFSRKNDLESFSVQAVKDFGYYGYFADPFKKYIDVDDVEGYYKRVMLPAEWADTEFDDYNYRFVTDFLTENDPKMIFIYGEWDPWTASGVTWLRDRNKQNIKIYIEPDGSHRARIGTMPEDVQKEILDTLNEWMQYR